MPVRGCSRDTPGVATISPSDVMDDKLPLPQSAHLAGREEWRRWLEENHHGSAGIWLVIRKKAAALVAPSYEEAVEEALCFGWIDGQMHGLDGESFALRFSPRRPGSLWSLVNRERAEGLVRQDRMAPAGLAAVEEAKRTGRWEAAYTSRREPDIPPDLQVALDADPAARQAFAALSRSQRTRYAVWVQLARSPENRRRRVNDVVRRRIWSPDSA
jgi:uncharacterized protein YdeI (YjbR/CyaY-like superfamily)